MKLLLFITLLSQPFTYGYMQSTTTLYSDALCQNPLTTLPATYFVIVLEESDNFYKVSYKDITGYVSGIEIVDYEPVTKYASATFDVNNDGYPVKLRSSPTAAGEVITEIPNGKSGYYYGEAKGDSLIAQVGSLWYYVSYFDGSDTYHGYVYSSQISVSEISANVIEKVPDTKGEEIASPPLDNTDFFLIVCLCVPSVLIMYLVFGKKERAPRYKE